VIAIWRWSLLAQLNQEICTLDSILNKKTKCFSDSLVLNLQLFHDGHLPGWLGVDDINAHVTQRLRKVFKG
jgi:hypothetical protein